MVGSMDGSQPFLYVGFLAGKKTDHGQIDARPSLTFQALTAEPG